MKQYVYVVVRTWGREANDVFYDETKVEAVYANEKDANDFVEANNPKGISWGEYEYEVKEFEVLTALTGKL